MFIIYGLMLILGLAVITFTVCNMWLVRTYIKKVGRKKSRSKRKNLVVSTVISIEWILLMMWIVAEFAMKFTGEHKFGSVILSDEIAEAAGNIVLAAFIIAVILGFIIKFTEWIRLEHRVSEVERILNE